MALVAVCLVGLAVLVVVFGVAAVDKNARADRLRHHGVVVNVTVTDCVALLSGTGATEYAFSCKGSFVLDGQRFIEVIGGTKASYPPGTTLRAETDPSHPADLTVKYAELASHHDWRAFVTPAILLLLLVFFAVVAVWRFRRAVHGLHEVETQGQCLASYLPADGCRAGSVARRSGSSPSAGGQPCAAPAPHSERRRPAGLGGLPGGLDPHSRRRDGPPGPPGQLG